MLQELGKMFANPHSRSLTPHAFMKVLLPLSWALGTRALGTYSFNSVS